MDALGHVHPRVAVDLEVDKTWRGDPRTGSSQPNGDDQTLVNGDVASDQGAVD